METILITILRAVFVLLILVGMAVVLLAINHYLLNPQENDTDRLKRDVEENDNVISKDSIFHTFLVRDSEKNRRDKSMVKHHNAD